MEKLLDDAEDILNHGILDLMCGFALHKMVYDASGNAVDYTFLQVNPEFERLTGLKATSVIGKQATEILPNLDHIWIKQYAQVAQGKNPLYLTQFSKLFNRYYDVVVYSPKAGYFITLFFNVTKREIKFNALKDKLSTYKQRYEVLFNHLSSGVAIYSTPDGGESFVIEHINKRGEVLSAVVAKDVVGKPLLTVFPAAAKIGVVGALRKTYLTGEVCYLPLRTYDDGRIVEIVENRTYPLPNGEVVAIYDDFSELESKNRLIKEQFENFQSIFQLQLDALFILSLEGYIIEVNDAACKMHHWNRSEFIGQSYHEFIHPSSFHLIRQFVLENSQKDFSCQGKHITKTREVFDVAIKGRKIHYNNQSVVLACVRDITQELHVKSVLEVEKNNFEALFESQLDTVFIFDSDGIIINANKAACESHKQTKEGLIGKTHEAIVEKESYPLFRNFIKTTQQGEAFNCIAQDITSSGEIIEIEVRGKAIMYNGKRCSMAVLRNITEDITQSRELALIKERLNLAVIASTDGVWDINYGDNSHYISSQWKAMLGYGESELKGHQILERVIHPDDAKRVELERDIFVENQKKTWESMFRLRHKDGHYIWVKSRALAQWNLDNQLERILGIHTDITDLIEAKKVAEEANRAKSLFLSNVTHELRTPMNAIIGVSQYFKDMKNSHFTKKEKNALEMIYQSGEKLLELINGVMDFSVIEQNGMQYQGSIISVNHFLSEMLKLGKGLLVSSDVKFRVENSCNGLYFSGDRKKIDHIVSNIISNAVKFTNRGEVVLKILYQKPNIILHVKDTGIGIEKDFVPKLFERFEQGNKDFDKKIAGTGIGLSIVKHYIDFLKGSIAFQSEKNVGTDVEIKFPVDSVGYLEDFVDKDKIIANYPQDILLELIALYKTEYPLLLSDIYRNMEENNFDALTQNCHKLVNKFSVFYADTLVTLARQAEKLSNEKEGVEVKAVISDIVGKEKYFKKFLLELEEEKECEQKIEIGGQRKNQLKQCKKNRYLMVEDDEMNIKLYQFLLEDYNIVYAKDGEEAVEKFFSQSAIEKPFKGVFLDIMLPKLSGYEVFEKIKNHGVPIIALTAHALSAEKEKMKQYGFSEWLTKPVTKRDLIDVMMKWMELERG